MKIKTTKKGVFTSRKELEKQMVKLLGQAKTKENKALDKDKEDSYIY